MVLRKNQHNTQLHWSGAWVVEGQIHFFFLNEETGIYTYYSTSYINYLDIGDQLLLKIFIFLSINILSIFFIRER